MAQQRRRPGASRSSGAARKPSGAGRTSSGRGQRRGSAGQPSRSSRRTGSGSGRGTGRSGGRAAHAGSGRSGQPQDPRAELNKVAGPNAEKAYRRLMEAADAFAADRFKDAKRLLQPLRDQYPNAVAVAELYALVLYGLGDYGKAVDELERFRALTRSTDQHPVLMDCLRALRRDDEVETLWNELREVSPSGALVTEGRIVMAGSLADRGRLDEALALLRRGPVKPKRAQDHHLRLWYALADLEERSGNLPGARALFEQIRRRDAAFADVAERLAALG